MEYQTNSGQNIESQYQLAHIKKYPYTWQENLEG